MRPDRMMESPIECSPPKENMKEWAKWETKSTNAVIIHEIL